MTPEPVTIGDAIPSSLRARLEALGAAVPVVDMSRTETPEEAHERHLAATAHRRARWERRTPARYARATLDGLDGEQRQPTVMGFLDRADAATLVLAGTVGTGKTHAAYALGNTAVERGLWAESWTAHDLLEALRPGGDESAAYAARNCHVLVLDDLSARTVTEWAQETMTALLDHRVANRRRQVITTNVPSEELATAWGQRFLDRLMEDAVFAVFAGESRRKPLPW